MFLEVVQPMIFEANYNNDQAFIEKMVLKGTKYINMGYVPLIICGVVVSKPFITVWMGEEYGQYGYWSAFFMSQYLFSPIVGVIGSVVVGMSKIRPLQIFSACSVSLNLVISIIALKIIGLPGVLVGTVTSTYIVLIFAYPIYCRLVGISWRKPLVHNWKISFVLIFVFMFPGIWLGNLLIHSWLTFVVFSSVFMILIYAAMFLLFVEDEERNKIEALVRRFLVRA
jgi:O-antigen/teichoic acid export membrane protein